MPFNLEKFWYISFLICVHFVFAIIPKEKISWGHAFTTIKLNSTLLILFQTESLKKH